MRVRFTTYRNTTLHKLAQIMRMIERPQLSAPELRVLVWRWQTLQQSQRDRFFIDLGADIYVTTESGVLLALNGKVWLPAEPGSLEEWMEAVL